MGSHGCHERRPHLTLLDSRWTQRHSGRHHVGSSHHKNTPARAHPNDSYDLNTHLCAFNGRETYDFYDPNTSPAWQPLETVLSVYIDMIERGKAVALHKDIVRPDELFFRHPDNDQFVHFEDHPNPPPRADLATGATRQNVHTYDQWTMVPHAKQDVEDALSAWDDLLNAINERKPGTSQPPTAGIFTDAELQGTSLRANGFAWQFFLRARKPDFTYIGPGLRLASLEELSGTLFPDDDRVSNDPASREDLIRPVPILLGSQTATSWLGYPFAEATQVPWGLFLDACELNGPCPFEDGCRLVLPFPLGQNGFARTADGAPLSDGVNDGHAELYQIGYNPFILDHPSQMLAVLLQFKGHVRDGLWNVDADGVEGNADVFRQADTDMDITYRLPLGAGDRYW